MRANPFGAAALPLVAAALVLSSVINESDTSVLIDRPDTMQTFVEPEYIDACWQPCAERSLPQQDSRFVKRKCNVLSW